MGKALMCEHVLPDLLYGNSNVTAPILLPNIESLLPYLGRLHMGAHVLRWRRTQFAKATGV